MSYFTIDFKDGKVLMLDQRRLPEKEVYLKLGAYEQVAKAIEQMAIRGAPAIGIAAGFGLALAGLELRKVNDHSQWWQKFGQALRRMARTRPTAVNLFWAINRMNHQAIISRDLSSSERAELLVQEAKKILAEDIAVNKKMGKNGAKLIRSGDVVLTHCNAGALATGGYGTALGVIRAAVEQGKKIQVFADETRPFLQGARLTAWELKKDRIPVTLISDNMAGWAMKSHKISKIIVGADRIARNGDTANKIGTYSLAVLARYHKINFYVAAPLSTIDRTCPGGENIPIEERSLEEIFLIKGKRIAPKGVRGWNPAFDVTPAGLISALITEAGVVKNPNPAKIKSLFNQ